MKTIKVNGYPAHFEFKIRTELPKFDNDEYLRVDWDNITEEEYVARPQYKAEQVRRKLLLKYLKKLNIYSFGHAYEDYVVEVVTETEDGEIWQLGS